MAEDIFIIDETHFAAEVKSDALLPFLREWLHSRIPDGFHPAIKPGLKVFGISVTSFEDVPDQQTTFKVVVRHELNPKSLAISPVVNRGGPAAVIPGEIGKMELPPGFAPFPNGGR